MLMGLLGCENRQEHIAPAIYPKDSVSVMTSYGVNTLISDSGVIKYRIVAERWDVNQAKRISRWTFDKGLFWSSLTKNCISIVISRQTPRTIMTNSINGSCVVGCGFLPRMACASPAKNSSGMRISTSCGAISIAGLSRLNVPWRVLISVVTRR